MGTIKARSSAPAILAWLIAGLFSAASAFGAAVVQDFEGDVRVGTTPAESKPAAPNQRVLSGTSVITARGARVTLRFDDGQVVALHENTEFRIEVFYYQPQEPKADRAVFRLLRGALRVMTGALGRRNRDAFALEAPTAMIGIRGTDFMVSIVNPTYVSVLRGSVAATNTAGTTTFEAGAFGTIASPSTLAVSISESALPVAAESAFRSLGALPLTPADSSGGAATDEIKRPEKAAPQAHDAAAPGLEKADKARELNGEHVREAGKELSETARERARDRASPNRERQ